MPCRPPPEGSKLRLQASGDSYPDTASFCAELDVCRLAFEISTLSQCLSDTSTKH